MVEAKQYVSLGFRFLFAVLTAILGQQYNAFPENTLLEIFSETLIPHSLPLSCFLYCSINKKESPLLDTD